MVVNTTIHLMGGLLLLMLVQVHSLLKYVGNCARRLSDQGRMYWTCVQTFSQVSYTQMTSM